MRKEINKTAIELSQKFDILALEWATGVGKSKAALDIANTHRNNKEWKALLVVAELAHIKNWEDEVSKWEMEELYSQFTIVTYASLKHHKDKFYNLLILDEAHHVGSDIRMEILDSLRFNKLLLLSATLDENFKNKLIMSSSKDIHFNIITLNEAIEKGILPEPIIHLMPLKLDNRRYSEIFLEEWGTKSKRVIYKTTYEKRWDYIKYRKKYPHVTLEVSCTPRQKYMMINDKVNYFKKRTFQTNNPGLRNKWMQLALERKRFLGEMKTHVVNDFLNTIEGIRYICFCTSIEQADFLNKKRAIHSKMDNPELIINNFNEKKISSIFAVGMIKEGQNLTDIEAGVMIQLDGVIRPFIQKFGRSLRAENPVQYIFYYTNTRDEEYLNEVLKEIDNKYIHKDEDSYR